MKPARLALLVLVLLPLAARASDVRVSYTVDDKMLKTAIAGTMVTFQLYSNNTCTTTVGAPVVVPIENVNLIEKLKRGTPKGATKGPTTDRLNHVLTGVSVLPTLYLKLTGTGITAVGGDCQLQLTDPLPCASQVGTNVLLTGCNLNVRSGSGSTDGPINGLGNVIIGYNENTGAKPRTGSHNLIVGPEHGFSSFGGLVAGVSNTVSAPYASVSGGEGNTASNIGASVSAGTLNTASGKYASVSAGTGNTASGNYASVSGGKYNTASGYYSSVSGGGSISIPYYGNTASGQGASVSGGRKNVASGSRASISGGQYVTAAGFIEWHAQAYSGAFPTFGPPFGPGTY